METNTTPSKIKLDQGIHVMHLFYNVNRIAWSALTKEDAARSLQQLETLCKSYTGPAHPRLSTYVNVGGKADWAFMLYHEDAVALGRMHRELEVCFPAGTLQRVYTYLSVTETSEYASKEEDMRQMLIRQEKLDPETEEFKQRLEVTLKKLKEYSHYRLYPELPDWEVMGFYPMNKRRQGQDNWYSLEFADRKKLMGGHARVGRKYAGRISQLITGSTGLDDWEWGVTLMAHQLDALKEIVYEMRFDEVSARYGDFGVFYINLRMEPAAAWDHLGL